MRNRMYGGVRGRKTKVGEKLLRFPPTRYYYDKYLLFQDSFLAVDDVNSLQYRDASS